MDLIGLLPAAFSDKIRPACVCLGGYSAVGETCCGDATGPSLVLSSCLSRSASTAFSSSSTSFGKGLSVSLAGVVKGRLSRSVAIDMRLADLSSPLDFPDRCSRAFRIDATPLATVKLASSSKRACDRIKE